MCNLYSSYATQVAMRQAFDVPRDSAGNLPPLPAIFPDQMAPVIRNHDGERELIQMRWGFPPPPKVGNHPVTNVRIVGSPFWRAWLKPQYRALVPVTSFSEYKDTRPRKTPVWFALNEERPLRTAMTSTLAINLDWTMALYFPKVGDCLPENAERLDPTW